MITDMLSLLPDARSVKFDSRYRLVLAASQRAKHLVQGAKPIGGSRFAKDTTIGIDEVLYGKIPFLVGKDARQAIKTAKRGKDAEAERLSMAEATEDATEIKKELSVYVDDSAKATESESDE